MDYKVTKKTVKSNGFWKINAIRPKIKARRGRTGKLKNRDKANWRGSAKELGCQIVTQFMTLEIRKVSMQNGAE